MVQKFALLVFFASLFFITACEVNPLANSLMEGNDPIPASTSTPIVNAISVNDDATVESQAIDRPQLTCADKELHCIGVLINRGLFNDKSFNQSTWEGAQRAKADLAAHVEYLEADPENAPEERIEYFTEKEFDIIITIGFNWSEITNEAAKKFPDIAFIGVDQFQPEEIENVSGLIFPERNAGFLAGALAAIISESGTVAAVLEQT